MARTEAAIVVEGQLEISSWQPKNALKVFSLKTGYFSSNMAPVNSKGQVPLRPEGQVPLRPEGQVPLTMSFRDIVLGQF
jgi:hypothetical protein